MSFAIIGGVVGVLGAGYGVYSGARQKSKAKKELDKLNANEPIETIPTEVLKNQELASLRAKTGLPSEQYSMAMKNIQRQQAKTLRGASDRRMGLGLLASVDDNANRAVGSLDAQNAQARLHNEKVSMDTNNQVANWKKGIYDRNVRQIWNRNFDYNMGLMGAGNQNIANGINSGINLASSALIGSGIGRSGSNSSWAAGLFGNSNRARRTTYSGGGNERQLYDADGNPVYNA
jgi:hypothetical protein